jgi:hypothetical protein
MTFDIDKEFSLYLRRVNLEHLDKESAQYNEMKRAFYGACGQIVIYMTQDCADLPEEEAMKEIDNIIYRVGEFFNRQV